MADNDIQGYDPRPVFDIRLVPLRDHFKSAGAMKLAYFKAALPDLAIAGVYLYSIIAFLHISPEFRGSMEGLTILELIVLIFFPIMFRVFATKEKPELRATPKLRFMTGWINVFNILFVLAIMGELAYFSSLETGRQWIPLQLVILAGSKVYIVFFSGEKKVKPMTFVSRMTARLAGGLFCGIFTYIFAALAVGLLLNPQMLGEIAMLLVGYVFFVMMGIFSIYKQDFLLALDPPSNIAEHDQYEEMICEVWYPRMEIPLDQFKKPDEGDFEKALEAFQKTQKQSWAFVVLLLALLLPAISVLPMRSKFLDHAKENRSEISKNKVVWEDRFNWGAGIVFVTGNLWIFFVVIMMLFRDAEVKKQTKA